MYTSGVIATIKDNRSIILFETNVGHAGEFIDDILINRDKSQPVPLIMCDALSGNSPSVVAFILALCNSHARRKFYDVISHFPDEVNEVLKRYGKIWENEREIKKEKMSQQNRLAYHKAHSLPEMAAIKKWGEDHFKQSTIEENSSLGVAIAYFINHYEGLTCFCRVVGAQIDNNRMEAELKGPIRDRKNGLFHKTLAGASISDVITSLFATSSKAGVNVFEYFNFLQLHREEVAANPQNYLPWNYS